MSPLIARAESILAQLAAIREAATKGEWHVAGPFVRDKHDRDLASMEMEFPWEPGEGPRPLEDPVNDARAIVARINGWQADEDLVRGMLNTRKKMSDCFGGMGKTSAIWSNNPYDKGHTAGVLAAVTAFDATNEAALTRWCERWEEVLKGVA